MGNRPIGLEYKITVLVVDDDFETRENVTRALTFEALFEVVGTANNGLEAIALTKSIAPDRDMLCRVSEGHYCPSLP
jgi:chemotaxis response regulator CheB